MQHTCAFQFALRVLHEPSDPRTSTGFRAASIPTCLVSEIRVPRTLYFAIIGLQASFHLYFPALLGVASHSHCLPGILSAHKQIAEATAR